MIISSPCDLTETIIQGNAVRPILSAYLVLVETGLSGCEGPVD